MTILDQHLCLVELEIRPATEKDREYYGEGVVGDWRVDTRTISNRRGFYRNGFEYELEAVGEGEILELEGEYIRELIGEKIKEYEGENQDGDNWPIRFITVWKHRSTYYPDTPFTPEEYATELELVGELDIDSIKTKD